MQTHEKALLHGLKVAAWVAGSGALVALASYVSGLHPTTTEGVMWTGIVNTVLSSIVSYVKNKADQATATPLG